MCSNLEVDNLLCSSETRQECAVGGAVVFEDRVLTREEESSGDGLCEDLILGS